MRAMLLNSLLRRQCQERGWKPTQLGRDVHGGAGGGGEGCERRFGQRRRALCAAFALLACAAGNAFARAPSAGCGKTDAGEEAAARGVEQELEVDGQKRTYILDVPPSALGRVPVPLLLDFHGFQHSAAGVWRVSEFKRLGEENGFVTAYPQGLPVQLLGREGAGWQIFTSENNRDLRFVRALIDHLAERYCIDRHRIYATGFSNGGFLAHLLACHMADVISGIAPVGAGLLPVPCTPARALPVIIHHGTIDDRVPIERARALRDRWRELNGCDVASDRTSDGCLVYRHCRSGGAVVFCESELGHHWPPGASERIWRFFEQHRGADRDRGMKAPACAGCVPTP
ncbi:MAG: hypothetical protein N3C12_12880 [Candidatus Binatia bacterium]|nr:hypothetical protein [Candidatus Binatia bacterium]